MNNPLISVIIPIYNVEKYLDSCIASVANQTYKNLEIILVDDGSPDLCPQICDDWATKDSRVRVIHKTNSGLSNARNTGLQNSAGEYIYFLDSDDWIELDMIQSLYEACSQNNVLLSVCGRYAFFEENNHIQIDKCPTRDEVVASTEFVSQMLIGNHCDSSACDKLFHRSLWNSFRFPEGLIYEDVAIMYKVVLSTSRIATIRRPLYYYRRHPNSIVTSGFTKKLFDYPINTRKLLEDIKQNHAELFEHACWTHTKALTRVLDKLSRADRSIYLMYRKEYMALQKELASFAKIWNSSPVFNKRDKNANRLFSLRYAPRFVGRLKIIAKKTLRKVKGL